MLIRPFRRRRSAFTLIELLIVIAIIALLIGILLPAIGNARKSARMAVCMSNMRQFAVAMASYASENKDKLFNYSWFRGTPIPPDFARFLPVKVQYADNDVHGAAMQFTYVMQKRLGLTDPNRFLMPENWFPYVYYSHIPLMDYMSAQMPMPVAACPEDRSLILLQKSYDNVDNAGTPVPPNSGDSDARWRFPFRMSYTIHTSHYSPDKVYNIMDEGRSKRAPIVYATNGGMHFSDGDNPVSSIPTGALGNRRIVDIRFPSQKTWASDSLGRHFGRMASYYADPTCRQPLAFYDSSVRVFMTGDTNPGWDPTRESTRKQMGQRLAWVEELNDYSPPVANTTSKTGADGKEVRGYAAATGWYQMTRGGLRGWDVPRGAVRSQISNGKMEYKVENELDTSVTNAY
ncbi:MAG: prepilin-type N-terminal cleavage/methylation domain-containing protein [Phycisphaeraceae bacterium]|nr:prepilin-type N-terminal cleavage/methylation domain-containing protein [Phycisphaeraceae bacterium]